MPEQSALKSPSHIVIGSQVVDWVVARIGPLSRPAVGIGLERNGILCAGIVFNEYNGANIFMQVASDGTRRWMSRELLRYVFHYAFIEAGVRRISGAVLTTNADARRFDEHIGFVEEARLKDAHPGGDLIIYCMTRAQCRWLALGKDGEERNHELRQAA